MKNTIFMQYPASWWHDMWREGLVSGNGRIGANVYGGVKDETTMLTHHRLWHNGKTAALPDVSGAFRRLRQKQDAGEFKEASWEIVNALKDAQYHAQLESPFPAADLLLHLSPVAAFTDYQRGIHLNSGEVFSRWREGESVRSSTLFVSRADGVVVKQLVSNRADISAVLSLDAHKNAGSDGLEVWGKHILDSKESTVSPPYLVYTALNDDGRLYGVCAKVIADGAMSAEQNALAVADVSRVLAIIAVFAGKDAGEKAAVIAETQQQLDAIPADYARLLSRHQTVHEAFYNSAELSLGSGGAEHSNEELLLQAYSGKQPLELVEKLWHYGRYLFISGTDESADPFPMYGLWGGDYRLEWAHTMANENIQMIYWHSYAGNLLPFQKAFYRYYTDRLGDFRTNAQKLFGLRGMYVTAGTTPGVSAPNQIVPVIINWVSAAGWLAEHYYLYYRYTADTAYFRSTLLPYLLEVAAFYEDFVAYDADGAVRFYPSVSPENTPQNFMPPPHEHIPHPMPTTVNSTIDLAILKEFLTNMCRIAAHEPDLKARVPAWEHIIAAIPAYKTNADGAIREWQDERFSDRYAHRHLSHLYPVFPASEVNKLHGAELLPAFERAVELREIDAQTGWSMAHMAAVYARLEKGEDALGCLNKLAQSSLTNSFFTLHNDWRGMNISLSMDSAPVQLDAIMGYVNAVQEMLFYASDDLIKLLPALPAAFATGSFSQFRYAHGFVDVSWNAENRTFTAEIRAIRAHEICVQLPPFASSYRVRAANCSIENAGSFLRLSAKADGVLKIDQEHERLHSADKENHAD